MRRAVKLALFFAAAAMGVVVASVLQFKTPGIPDPGLLSSQVQAITRHDGVVRILEKESWPSEIRRMNPIRVFVYQNYVKIWTNNGWGMGHRGYYVFFKGREDMGFGMLNCGTVYDENNKIYEYKE